MMSVFNKKLIPSEYPEYKSAIAELGVQYPKTKFLLQVHGCDDSHWLAVSWSGKPSQGAVQALLDQTIANRHGIATRYKPALRRIERSIAGA